MREDLMTSLLLETKVVVVVRREMGMKMSRMRKNSMNSMTDCIWLSLVPLVRAAKSTSENMAKKIGSQMD